jgi:hypothetical protein
MKSLALLSALLITASVAFAQSTEQRTPQTVTQLMDLVVEVPRLDMNNYESLKSKLSKIDDMTVEGFCNTQKLLYLRFTPDQFFNVLVSINEAGYPYYIKKHTSIRQGMEACSDKGQLMLRESRAER